MAIDITKALSRGRRVSWSLESEGWVSFKYERLPSLCYWCGQLSHDDKDCTLWLQSKGSLTVKDRQFGPWIRAALFNQSKKTVVEVQGYEGPMHKSQNQPGGVSQNTNSQLDSMARGMNNELNQLLLGGAIAVPSRLGEAPIIGNPSAKQAISNFEEIIRDIDESIYAFTGISNSNLDLDKILEDNEERLLLDVPVFVAESTQLGGDPSKDMKGV